uniref:Helitron_like_N domain-containing protein n=1 Tax=Loa loa TaxID=7209 RepID=A0A1I7VQS8_LOALO
MINPICGETNKYEMQCNELLFILIIIRKNEDNHVLKCHCFTNTFIIDMYAKIETKRLTFIRLNQTKLRFEEYIHLRHAAVNYGNSINVGSLTILPSSYAGNPGHMHEYAEDAIVYVSKPIHYIHMQSSLGRYKQLTRSRRQ